MNQPAPLPSIQNAPILIGRIDLGGPLKRSGHLDPVHRIYKDPSTHISSSCFSEPSWKNTCPDWNNKQNCHCKFRFACVGYLLALQFMPITYNTLMANDFFPVKPDSCRLRWVKLALHVNDVIWNFEFGDNVHRFERSCDRLLAGWDHATNTAPPLWDKWHSTIYQWELSPHHNVHSSCG